MGVVPCFTLGPWLSATRSSRTSDYISGSSDLRIVLLTRPSHQIFGSGIFWFSYPITAAGLCLNSLCIGHRLPLAYTYLKSKRTIVVIISKTYLLSTKFYGFYGDVFLLIQESVSMLNGKLYLSFSHTAGKASRYLKFNPPSCFYTLFIIMFNFFKVTY